MINLLGNKGYRKQILGLYAMIFVVALAYGDHADSVVCKTIIALYAIAVGGNVGKAAVPELKNLFGGPKK